MNDTIENLRKYNLWRRGDELIEQPDPKDIGIWIDEICEIAEKLERERDEARVERDILRLDAQREAEHHDRMVGELEKVYKERDEAQIECLEQARLLGMSSEREAKLISDRDEAREKYRFAVIHWQIGVFKMQRERDEAREEFKNEMKWHHQTHKELVEAQCKLLDIEYDKLKS